MLLELTPITLDKNSSNPLYRQLAGAIKAAVRRGELVEGTKLPPIRKLAEVLGISPITVSQAYDLLAVEGVTGGQVGRGTFILPASDTLPVKSISTPPVNESRFPPFTPQYPTTHQEHLPSPTSEWTDALHSYVRPNRAGEIQRLIQRAARQWGDSDSLINLANANPNPELFSMARWRQSMTQAGLALEQDATQPNGNAALQYGSARGDLPLRTFLATYLSVFGFQPDPDEIMLTSGSQQALDLVARVFVGPGDPVFVEEWTYVATLDIFEQRGVEWRPVPLDQDGICLDALEQMLGAPQQRPRLLYLVPTAQSPTGLSLSLERRRRLMALARRYNLLVIEDDHCNEIYYEGQEPALAVRSFARDGRVIYLKSFSKTIFPALRIGCIVAAPPVLTRLIEGKQVFDRVTSIPLARAVLTHISAPAYEHELETYRAEYHRRRDLLLEILERELAGSGCRWTVPLAGFSLALTLPGDLEEQEVVEKAAARGLVLIPSRLFSAVVSTQQEGAVRLTFADKSLAQLEEAVRRLASTLRCFRHPSGRQAHGLDLLAPV